MRPRNRISIKLDDELDSYYGSSPLVISDDDRTLRFTISRGQELCQMLMALYVHSPSYESSTCVVECPSHCSVSPAHLHNEFDLPIKLVSNRFNVSYTT